MVEQENVILSANYFFLTSYKKSHLYEQNYWSDPELQSFQIINCCKNPVQKVPLQKIMQFMQHHRVKVELFQYYIFASGTTRYNI